ncbi:MAG: agmatinase [Acidobacteriota bacterium]
MTDFGGALRKNGDYDFALIGVPFDGKSSYLKGTAKAPLVIREASTSLAINAWTETGINLEEETVFVDLGDIDASGNYSKISPRIEEKVFEVCRRGAVPVILGGDHSISFPAVRGAAKIFPHLDILHFDAHPDLYNELYGDPYSHACPFSRIMEEKLAENLIQVGVRAVVDEHRRNASRFKVKMIEMKELGNLPALSFSNPLYISFDIDVLDPAFAPGVSHHEPGGLTTREAIQLIHSLQAEIVAIDLVEVNPSRDHSGITAAAAVKIIMEIMGKALLGKRKKYRK